MFRNPASCAIGGGVGQTEWKHRTLQVASDPQLEKSDWYRNVQKKPQVLIQVKHRKMEAVAERLPLEEAEREILDYARRYPRFLRALSRMIGYKVEDNEGDYRALAGLVPIIAFRPNA